MRGSIRLSGARWRVVVEAGADPVTGKRRQLVRSVTGTKRDAEAVLARLLADVGQGAHRGHDAALANVVAAWIAHVDAGLSPATARDYRYATAKHLDGSAIGRIPVWKLTANDLDRWYRTLQVNGLGAARVQRLHAIVRRSLAQAVRWGWVPRNVAVDASPPSALSRRITPPEPAEVRALLAAAGDEFATVLALDASTGARRGELVALQWPDVDLERGELVIRRALVDAGGRIVAKATKTGRERVIALDGVTVDVLRRHRRCTVETALALGVGLRPDAWVFSRDPEGGIPWRPDYITQAFRRIRARAGCEHVRFHDLRHFVATQLLAAGVDPRTVSGRLGHARTSTTLDLYGGWVPARDRDAADLIGRILSGG